MSGKAEPADDVPTPEQATPEAVTSSTPVPSAGAPERSSSSSSEASDPCDDDGGEEEDDDDDDDGRSTPKPDDSTVHGLCDRVLQEAFGIQVKDLASIEAVSAAYESVSYCLDELSRIVLNSGVRNAGIGTFQAARGGAGSATTPIRLAGGDANHGGAGGGSSGASGNRGSGRKRFNDARDGAGPSGGSGGDTPDGGKRLKVSPQRPSDKQSDSVRYSCPFRKRNPVRFNVRDFQNCAVQGFPDIPQLKRDMGSRTALEEHLAVDKAQICNPQQAASSADPEDGITNSIEDTLNDRKAVNKIDCWEGLWHLLFPQDPQARTPDFIPPTELDEVYAQLNSENCVGQLRQRIQDGIGSDSDVDLVFDIFQQHIHSVFEECRLKTGGAAGGRRRIVRPQTPRELPSRQSSTRLTPAQHRRQGSGFSDSNISSPYVATPQSASILGNSELLLTAEPQTHMPYMPSISSYASSTTAGVGGLVTTSLLPPWVPPTSKGGQPVTMPPPPPHFPMGFNNQMDTLKRQLAHATGPAPVNPGVDLTSSVLSDQAAGDFSPHVPQAAAFGSYNGWDTMPGFGQQQRLPDLHLQVPSASGMQAVQGQGISPTDAVMVPSIEFTGYDGSVTDNDGYEVVRHQNEWA
ncbi:uncharacterized protein B0T15DRAFT_398611 [Chaetomium strumarium]|uniref:Uncharacterized protein n=1 Tax=Chaetomium strumarium TaxID=1170767 RepID=A0AAJ0GPV0_9PEZI|nr:hypothetical protein B0T15DRAFT_398611 [Chaetomium strumarium]